MLTPGTQSGHPGAERVAKARSSRKLIFAGLTRCGQVLISTHQSPDAVFPTRPLIRRDLAMFTPKGKFSWYELMTSDTKAGGKFYSDVVGWTTQEMPSPEGQTYTIFNLGSIGIAGMINIPGHVGWVGYIAVDDVDAHIEKIVEAGGKLWKPATDVPGMLRFAVLSDPQGAAIVVFTPNPNMPTPQRPAPPTPGTIGWHELYTTELEAGFSFYNKLFGWTKVSDMDMGQMGVYRIFDEGEHKQMEETAA